MSLTSTAKRKKTQMVELIHMKALLQTRLKVGIKRIPIRRYYVFK